MIWGDLCADVLGGALSELSLSQFALLSLRLRLVLVVFVAEQLCLTVGQCHSYLSRHALTAHRFCDNIQIYSIELQLTIITAQIGDAKKTN